MRALLLLFSYLTLVECIIPLNVLISIIDQFKLFDIVIQKNCFTPLIKKEFFKMFVDRGKMLNLNEKTIHSTIRCTETIKKLSLNKPIKIKTVVISQIETENDLNTIDISIGEEVYFIDKNTFKIYESYTINNVHVTGYLGQFYEANRSSAFFSPANDFIDSFVDRRKDFHGIQLIGMTEEEKQHTNINIPDNFADNSNYFPENETYDVTNIVSGTYINALNHLEKSLNFSTKLYKRKDGIWGGPMTLANGTVILNGIIKSITENNVDMICAALSMIQSRMTYVDYLVPVTQSYASLFIANHDNFDVIDWTVYLSPFSIWIWLITISSAITFMTIMTIIERQYNEEIVSNFLVQKYNSIF